MRKGPSGPRSEKDGTGRARAVRGRKKMEPGGLERSAVGKRWNREGSSAPISLGGAAPPPRERRRRAGWRERSDAGGAGSVRGRRRRVRIGLHPHPHHLLAACRANARIPRTLPASRPLRRRPALTRPESRRPSALRVHLGAALPVGTQPGPISAAPRSHLRSRRIDEVPVRWRAVLVGAGIFGASAFDSSAFECGFARSCCAHRGSQPTSVRRVPETIARRQLEFGANTPWYRVGGRRGGVTMDARRDTVPGERRSRWDRARARRNWWNSGRDVVKGACRVGEPRSCGCAGRSGAAGMGGVP